MLLTATCPPPLQSEILSILGIQDCHVIHAPTDRPEISYRVQLYPDLDTAKAELVQAAKRELEENTEGTFRGLVYCRSKKNVEEIASLIGCDAFHASRPMEERKASFARWLEGRAKFIVCSSLLGCGIDVEGVTTVYHFGTPWSILDFVQESGRAGRGGSPSVSVVFASENEREPEVPDEEDLYGMETMREWVLQSSVCRRIALSAFLDHRRTTCTLLRGARLCDVCERESVQEHPARLVSFSSLTTTTDRSTGRRLELPTVPPVSLEYVTSAQNLAEDLEWVNLRDSPFA